MSGVFHSPRPQTAIQSKRPVNIFWFIRAHTQSLYALERSEPKLPKEFNNLPMPINLPNLDDRTFADLVEEAQALIPVYEPQWTNHNASDPGITLVELFAYLTEILIYRLNRVTDANVSAFLKLIDGIERIPSTRNRGMVCRIEGDENATSGKARSISVSLSNLSSPATCEDLVSLAKAADPQLTVTEVALNDEVRNVVLNLREQVLSLEETHVFSPSLLNVARFGFSRAGYFFTGEPTPGTPAAAVPGFLAGHPVGAVVVGGSTTTNTQAQINLAGNNNGKNL